VTPPTLADTIARARALELERPDAECAEAQDRQVLGDAAAMLLRHGHIARREYATRLVELGDLGDE
jgi:hypothetical protein